MNITQNSACIPLKKPVNKILIVEKQTDKEFLDNEDVHNSSRHINLKYNLHKQCLQVVVDQVQKYNLDFDLIKDYQVLSHDFKVYDCIISVGGDGTFLKASSKILDQVIIGVNSDVKNSLGVLLKFDSSNFDQVLKKVVHKNAQYQACSRLVATVNDQTLPFLGLNEVLVSRPKVYQTSKLEIELQNSKAYTIGNGLIISTNTGSTAFYKSAGGQPFMEPNYAYTNLLTLFSKGSLPNSKILKPEDRLVIRPQKQGHVLIFDADEDRQRFLSVGDRVVVFTDLSQKLKVVV
jgi:NAD+ kinase